MTSEDRRRFVALGVDGRIGSVQWLPTPELSSLDLAEGNSYREPEWPVPPGVDGTVWIQDTRYEASSRIDGLFERDPSGDLRPVERWDGLAVHAHWSGRSSETTHWSPILVFSSLASAVAWGRSVASRITLRLVETEPKGTYREMDGNRLDPGLIDDWDRTYA